MATYASRQSRTGSAESGPAPTGPEKESDDLAFSRAEITRQQQKQQARINADQHQQIGSQP